MKALDSRDTTDVGCIQIELDFGFYKHMVMATNPEDSLLLSQIS